MIRIAHHVWLPCLVIVGAAAAAPTAPPVPSPTTAPVLIAPSDALAKKLGANVPAVRVDRLPLSDVFDHLRDIGHANIHVDWRALAKLELAPRTAVTADEPAMPLGKMIDAMVHRASAGKAVALTSGNIVWITSKEAAPPLLQRLRDWSRRTIDDPVAKTSLEKRLPEIKLNSIPMQDVVDFLRDITGANILVDWQALQRVGVKRNAPLSFSALDVTLSDALLLLIESIQADAALDVTAKDGVITITPAPKPPEA